MPPKEYFYSSERDGKSDRSDGHISHEQYLHLKNVSHTFNFDKFEDFHSHYLKKDISRCIWKIYFYKFKLLWFRSMSLI